MRLWHDQALFKEPGGRETDAPPGPALLADRRGPDDHGLDPPRTSPSTGVHGLRSGSHAIGLRRFVDIFSGDPEDLMDDPPSPTAGPCSWRWHAGRWPSTTASPPHLARPQPHRSVRQVHTVIYFADGSPVPSGQHPAVDRAGIRPGEPIRSDVTPVVWPPHRRADHCPPRPSWGRSPCAAWASSPSPDGAARPPGRPSRLAAGATSTSTGQPSVQSAGRTGGRASGRRRTGRPGREQAVDQGAEPARLRGRGRRARVQHLGCGRRAPGGGAPAGGGSHSSTVRRSPRRSALTRPALDKAVDVCRTSG